MREELSMSEEVALRKKLEDDATESFLEGESMENVKRDLTRIAHADDSDLKDLDEQRDPNRYRRLMVELSAFDRGLRPDIYGGRVAEIEAMHAKIKSEGPLSSGESSGLNECLIMQLESGAEGVYKPRSGEMANIGTPEDLVESASIRGIKLSLTEASSVITKTRREARADNMVAREWLSDRVDMILGLDVVPPTVVRTNSKGVGSVQEFKPGKTALRLKNWIEVADRESLIRMTVLDFLIKQTDRHTKNILIDEDNRAVAIDNGGAFPVVPEDVLDREMCDKGDDISSAECRRCRTVLLRMLGGEDIPENILTMLQTFRDDVAKKGELLAAMTTALGDAPGKEHWGDLLIRVDWILKNKKVPNRMYTYDQQN